MRRERATLAVAVAAALGVALLVAPGRAQAGVAACKRAYEDQRFDEAIKLCEAVAREPMAERAEVTAAFEIVGMAHLVLGRERPARAAFCQALAVDAGYRPTDPIYPQRFVAVFDAARASGCSSTLRLELAPATRRARAAVRVRALGAVPAVSRFGVFYRQEGDPRWRRELAPPGREATVELAKVSLAAGDVDVFATVLVDDETAVARTGTVDRPLRLARLARAPVSQPRREPGPTPIWRRTWFWWAVAGVAATALVVSVSVAATRGAGPRGSLDTWQLPLRLTWR